MLRDVAHNASIRAALLRHWESARVTRALSKVDQSAGPDACWPWIGSRDTKGYGRLKVAGKIVKAHRFVFSVLVRPLVATEALLHDCRPAPDNPACCNPKHLWPGTREENTKDAAIKRQLVRGERHHNAKLTDEQIAAVRVRYAAGDTQMKLAKDYGVSQPHISRIILEQSRRSPP